MARVFIAVPQYRPMAKWKERALAELFEFENWKLLGIHPRVAASVYQLNGMRNDASLAILRWDGLIERAQCTLFAEWLKCWNEGKKYDYLLRLDEDIEFHPSAIQSMIDADKPIIGGAYAYKTRSGDLAKKSVCKYLPGEKPDKNGIMKISWLNGGFQFWRSDALFKLIEAYPELRYTRLPGWGTQATESYALWTSMVRKVDTEFGPDTPLLLSEDYAISQRAIDIGMDVYLDTKVDLCHWDTFFPDEEDFAEMATGIKAIGYRIGRDPIVVTRDSKPWRPKSMEETISNAALPLT